MLVRIIMKIFKNFFKNSQKLNANEIAIKIENEKYKTLDKYLIDSINNLKIKKLWENPNKDNGLTNQNITLSSDDYDYLICIYKPYFSWKIMCSVATIKGYGFSLNFAAAAQISDGTNWKIGNFTRKITCINDTTYSIENNELHTPNGDQYGENGIQYGWWCVPIMVLGGKF